MQPSCAQPEGAGRQVLVSPPGVGPFPVTTPPCIRKKESSPLPTWKKPFRPSDPPLPPQTDFSLHTSCTWPEPQDRGRFRDADCPQNSQYTVSATTQSVFDHHWQHLKVSLPQRMTWHPKLKFGQSSAPETGSLGHHRAVLTSAQEGKDRCWCWVLNLVLPLLSSFRYSC